MGYHPKWKKSFVKSIISFLPTFFEKLSAEVQIIFTTHDPLTLSDMPKSNITYLSTRTSGETYILNAEEVCKKKTFGANIHDLLADNFFLEDGLMGDFAKDKIEKTIEWLREKLEEKRENTDFKLDALHLEKQHHLSIINIIDEPLLKHKLEEMYYDLFPDNIAQILARKKIEDIAKSSGLNVNFDN